MLVFAMRRAEGRGDAVAALGACLAELDGRFRLVLAETVKTQAAALGLDPQHLRPASRETRYGTRDIAFAEILAVDEGAIAVRLDRHVGRRPIPLEDIGPTDAWTIFLYGVGPKEIEQRLDEVASAIQGRLEIRFEPNRYRSDPFKALKGEGLDSPKTPTAEETQASKVLRDRAVRRAALAVASSGGLLVSDVPKQLSGDDEARADEVIAALQGSGIVESDLVVICSRNATQVARVPSREALRKVAASGMRCACGRKLNEERVEEALTLSTLGRGLLDGSRWMSVVLMDTLTTLGIDYDSMLIEHNADGDEMDCFADISGELALFELKDKEFSLGNAYSFGAKIGIHGPDHAIVVTTSYVGNDAKEHFKRAQKAKDYDEIGRPRDQRPVQYIEGIDNLAPALTDLIEGIAIGDASRALGALLPMVQIDPASLVDAIKHAHSLAEAMPAANDLPAAAEPDRADESGTLAVADPAPS